ncbi:MAG: MobF family relaxase, partial [Acidimicrobiales bacterium]
MLDEYDRRGRIVGGSEAGMEDAAYTAAVADRARGLRVYLLADTNETAARLAGRIRHHLVGTGQVDYSCTVILADGNPAGVGDEVVTRDNDRANISGDGRFVANRDTWTVTAIRPDGALRVARTDTPHNQTAPRVDLDAGYVAEQVQLAYAGTVHAGQGGTGDVCHAVLTARTGRHGAYVALTRGQLENRAYVICARPEGADRDGPPADPLAVLADILARHDPPEHAAALAVQADEHERAASLARLFPIWQDLIAGRDRHRTETALAGALGPEVAAETLRSQAWPTLAARLRRLNAAGIDTSAVLAGAAAGRDLDDADDVAAVLHWRL